MRKSILPVLLFLFSSCATQLMPFGSFVPQMQEKNDLKVKASLSTNSFQSAVAYAPFNHFAFKTDAGFTYNYITGIPDNISEITGWFTDVPVIAKNFYLEVTAGYFNKTNKNLIYEIYSGIGYGRAKYKYGYCGSDNSVYYQPVINFNLVYQMKSHSIGTSVNADYVFYNLFGTSDSYDKYFTKPFFSFEPYIFYKINNKVTYTFKLGSLFTFQNQQSKYQCLIDYSKLHISVGLSYNFTHKNKKQ